MKRYTLLYIVACLMMLFSAAQDVMAQAEVLKFRADENKHGVVSVDKALVENTYTSGFAQLTVLSNQGFTFEAQYDEGVDAFFTLEKAQDDKLLVKFDYNASPAPRTGRVVVSSPDGAFTTLVEVQQEGNTAANQVQGAIVHEIASGTASQAQSGEDIDKSFDGDMTTMYHSPHSGTKMPVTLTYKLASAQHVDYVVYYPRTTGNSNGHFGVTKIEYALRSAPSTFIEVETRDLGMNGSAARFNFGEEGVDNVLYVRVTVSSGAGGFASCAEFEICEENPALANELDRFFADKLCTTLRPEVTEDMLNTVSDAYVYQLVSFMLKGDYSTRFRVGEFEPFRPVEDLRNELRNSNAYDRYENPTGIYFKKDETIVLFVDGLDVDGASLIIKSFGPEQYEGEGQPETSYPLANGLNVINARNRGNGYISYYTPNYATAPNVKIHFALATETGYFNPDKGHTNEDWKYILANAQSDILDVYTRRLHVAGPVSDFKTGCPEDGLRLAEMYDNIVKAEWQIMGLEQYNREPKNRQFARCVPNGFMFADGIGAGIVYGSFNALCNPNSMDIWGLGHELGHNNQVSPGMKWVGCGETTNNISASWAQHKVGDGYHRLEDENSGVDSYSGWRGGRFNCYLEQGVRLGKSWQRQLGPDYGGVDPTETQTVADEDYNGNSTGQSVTVVTGNYDHFVKVVPFYQLALYTFEAEKAPETYGYVFEDIRVNYASDANLSNGQLQIKAMKRFCDGAKLNLLPFFEKAGMFKPVNAYVSDYSSGWLKINQEMLDELANYVKEKGYPEAPAALNYINAYNCHVFRDEAKLEENTVGAGCTKLGTSVMVMHDSWKNVVGFETYDRNGNLLHISMYGLGAPQKSSNYTKVLFPSTANYIMAVGYDGTKYKCYQR